MAGGRERGPRANETRRGCWSFLGLSAPSSANWRRESIEAWAPWSAALAERLGRYALLMSPEIEHLR